MLGINKGWESIHALTRLEQHDGGVQTDQKVMTHLSNLTGGLRIQETSADKTRHTPTPYDSLMLKDVQSNKKNKEK